MCARIVRWVDQPQIVGFIPTSLSNLPYAKHFYYAALEMVSFEHLVTLKEEMSKTRASCKILDKSSSVYILEAKSIVVLKSQHQNVR